MSKIIFIFIFFISILSYKSELKADLAQSYQNMTKSKNYDDCQDAINIDYVSVVRDCLAESTPETLEYYKYQAFIADKESNVERATHFYEKYIDNETNLKYKIQFHVLYGDFLLKNFKYFEGMRQYSKAFLYKNNPQVKDLQFLKLQLAQIEAGKTDIFYLLGYYPVAIENYKAIENKIKDIDDPQSDKTLLHIYYKLVDIYIELKSFNNAKIYVDKLQKLTEKSSAISYGAFYHVSYLHYKLYKEYYEPEHIDLGKLLESIHKVNEIKEVSLLDEDIIFKFNIAEALFNGFAENYQYAENLLNGIKLKEYKNANWYTIYRKKQIYQAIHVVKKIQGNLQTAMNNKFKEIDSMEDMVEHQDKEVILRLKKQVFDMQNEVKAAQEKLDILEKNNIINSLNNNVSFYNKSSMFLIVLFVLQFTFIFYFVIKRFIQHKLRQAEYIYSQHNGWMDSYLVVREKQPKETLSLVGIDFGYFDEYKAKLDENKQKSFQWLFEHFIKNNLRKGDMMIRYSQDRVFIIVKGTPDEAAVLCERLKLILESKLFLNGYLYFGIEEITTNQSTAALSVENKIKNGIKNRIFINK